VLRGLRYSLKIGVCPPQARSKEEPILVRSEGDDKR